LLVLQVLFLSSTSSRFFMHTGENSSKQTLDQIIDPTGGQSVAQPTNPAQSYLWAVGLDSSLHPVGKLLGDRYLVHDLQIVSDTQQYNLPECPDEFSLQVTAYLKLSCFPLNFPRPYALLSLDSEATGTVLSAQSQLTEDRVTEENLTLILENVPILPSGKLMPTLAESWQDATPLRQVNWLWQILQIWQPLVEFRMSSTLLEPYLARIDGCWVRFLELRSDAERGSLSQLGEFWKNLLEGTKPEIEEDLVELFFGMARGETKLDGAIATLDRINNRLIQTQPLATKVATATDPGTRRTHNEDSCYPVPNQVDDTASYLRDRVVIICDGLGGHEGGEVASSMAIKTLEQQLQVLLRQVESSDQPFGANTFMAQLNAIVRLVNDQIVALNDQQHRQAQQRMGTTLVMAVIPRPQGQPINQVFVVNVGDSRLYWINNRNCYQVTIDDDVANRDVILGFNLPAYAMQRIDAGSLTQAMGTRSGENLVPTIQRLLIDEACILLLCSDGLSDYERVPELWRSLVLPLLIGSQPLEKTTKAVLDQGNLRNGHDNITVGIIQCQFVAPEQAIASGLISAKPTSPELIISPTSSSGSLTDKTLETSNPDLDSQPIDFKESERKSETQTSSTSALNINNRGFLIGLILLILCFGVGIAVALVNSQNQQSEVVPVQPPVQLPK
jgi:protein phosphatase